MCVNVVVCSCTFPFMQVNGLYRRLYIFIYLECVCVCVCFRLLFQCNRCDLIVVAGEQQKQTESVSD